MSRTPASRPSPSSSTKERHARRSPGQQLPEDPAFPADGDQQLSWAIAMAGRLITQQFEKAAAGLPQKYSASQWAPLFMLVKSGTSTVRQLAASCALRETTVSAIICRLERDGYVVRERDSTDSRRVNVTPTESGRAAVRHAAPYVRSVLAEARKVLTDAEQEILFTLLSRYICAHTPAPRVTT